jgi:hypothetical protein
MGLRFKATEEAETNTRPVFKPVTLHKETVTPQSHSQSQSTSLEIIATQATPTTQKTQRRKRSWFRMTKRQASITLACSLVICVRWWQGAQIARLEKLQTLSYKEMLEDNTQKTQVVLNILSKMSHKEKIKEFSHLQHILSDNEEPILIDIKMAWWQLTDGLQPTYHRFIDQSNQAIATASLPYHIAHNQVVTNTNLQGIFDNFSTAYSSREHWALTRRSTQEQILLAKLALRAYQLEHQQLPPTLLTLVTHEYLKQVPTDGFSVTGDAILQYDAETGEVWSVGNNGTSDNNTGDDLLATP